VPSLSGSGATLLCVRDDLLHWPQQPLVAGSKARKLDALLPRLLASGARDVVSCGGLHSAHTAALSAACASAGLRAHLLFRGEPPAALTGHALAACMFAASVRFVPRSEYAAREQMLQAEAARLGAVVVPEGASCEAAVLGLLRGARAWSQPGGCLHARRVRLVLDCGTGCSAFGLALACQLLALPWTVTAVPVGGPVADAQARIRRLAADWSAAHPDLAARLDELPLTWAPPPARRFGECSPGDVAACRALARTTGVLTDPVWTLRAYEAASAATEAGGEEEVAWVHTGGAAGALDGAAQRYGYSHFVDEE